MMRNKRELHVILTVGDAEPVTPQVPRDRVDPGESLDCLTQTHLISQETVSLLIPGEVQPVDSLQLIRSQSVVVLEDRRLGPGLPTSCFPGSLNLISLIFWRRILPSFILLDSDGVNISLQFPGTVFIRQGSPLDKVMLGGNLQNK